MRGSQPLFSHLFSLCESTTKPWGPQSWLPCLLYSASHACVDSNHFVMMGWGNGPCLLLVLFWIISATPTGVIFLSVLFLVTSIQVWSFFAVRGMSSQTLVQHSGSFRVPWFLMFYSYDWLHLPSLTVPPLPLFCSEHGKHHSILDTTGFVCSQVRSSFSHAAH